ncbi:transposase [Mesorhizobium camelthorni]|uniref:Transposase n=1 Tax=Allomesorhizobium camelthorni TaxID=475069 RepID=A0A6G4WCA6_9HYPH|nr:transposase [Mesorhizobium camelthorni]
MVQYLVDKPTYALRNHIEWFFSHLKHSRSIATRYDKLASNSSASSGSQRSGNGSPSDFVELLRGKSLKLLCNQQLKLKI